MTVLTDELTTRQDGSWFGPFKVSEANPKTLVAKNSIVFVWLSPSAVILGDQAGQQLGEWPRSDVRVDIQSDFYGCLRLGKNSLWVNSSEPKVLGIVRDVLAGLTGIGFGAEIPTEPIAVYSYPGRTQDDASALFRRHASELAKHGYRPTSQSWGEGRPGIGRILAIGIMALAIRPDGFLTVTYERTADAPVSLDAPQRLAERLKELDEARDLGLITADEHASQRQRILDSA